MSENVTNNKPEDTIDYSQLSYDEVKEIVSTVAEKDELNRKKEAVRNQQVNIMKSSVKGDMADDALDILQTKLDEFVELDDLKKYLNGPVTDPNVKKRINEFFMDESGNEVEINSEGRTEGEELEFKRGLILYFKENDYYIEKIDEELKKMEEATEEFNVNMSNLLASIKDDLLNYANFLEDEADGMEVNSPQEEKIKKSKLSKAASIKNGYTFSNLIELVENNPKIIDNALYDFKHEERIKNIGKRYSDKLKTNNINFNLFNLLSDDIHDSLEYRTLPLDEYPNGLENFAVFFIIRCMAMGFNNKEDIVFHATAEVTLSKLMNNELDGEIADMVKGSLIKLLSYFDK